MTKSFGIWSNVSKPWPSLPMTFLFMTYKLLITWSCNNLCSCYIKFMDLTCQPGHSRIVINFISLQYTEFLCPKTLHKIMQDMFLLLSLSSKYIFIYVLLFRYYPIPEFSMVRFKKPVAKTYNKSFQKCLGLSFNTFNIYL